MSEEKAISMEELVKQIQGLGEKEKAELFSLLAEGTNPAEINRRLIALQGEKEKHIAKVNDMISSFHNIVSSACVAYLSENVKYIFDSMAKFSEDGSLKDTRSISTDRGGFIFKTSGKHGIRLTVSVKLQKMELGKNMNPPKPESMKGKAEEMRKVLDSLPSVKQTKDGKVSVKK